jgi:hypothetical protein
MDKQLKTYATPPSLVGGGVVSESDAIINFLEEERSFYKNTILTESYMDEEERMVLEAKVQALNEAVAGVIIAAIIAAVGALISAIIGFISMMKDNNARDERQFKEFVKNNEERNRRANEEVNKHNEQLRQQREKREKERKEEAEKKYERERKERKEEEIKGLKHEYDMRCLDYSFNRLNPAIQAKLESALVGENSDILGISDIYFPDFIDCAAIREINDFVDDITDEVNYRITHHTVRYTISDIASSNIFAGNKSKMAMKIFSSTEGIANGDEDLNDLCVQFTIREKYIHELNNRRDVYTFLLEKYNNKIIDIDKALKQKDIVKNDINITYKQSIKRLETVKSDCEKLKRKLGTYKDVMARFTQLNGWDEDSIKLGSETYDKFIKNFISNFYKTITAWERIEEQRRKILTKLDIVDYNARILYKTQVYEDFAERYGKDFTDNVAKPSAPSGL